MRPVFVFNTDGLPTAVGTMDLYTCLAGELLVPRTRNVARSLIGYQVKAGTCDACSPRSQCTTSKLGRQILRHFDEEYVDRVKG